ncbi:MAG TPA: polyprenyl synthetase family protein [Thermoanaerobaculia bacterium]|nr:polyprenyl synthetase family protein [Thermoanaerobaculia bacterium]
MKSKIRELREVAAWPEMSDLIDRAIHREWISVWDYPVAACQAVGGTEEQSLSGAAAVFCSVVSIHLVDDMLDDDPRGDYHRLGIGPAANLALAFQALGHRLLDEPPLDPPVRSNLQAIFAGMSLATAYGQSLDARELTSEQEYWRTVESKTPPLFAAALEIGALLGGASSQVAKQLAHFGHVLGLFVQVSDDLSDALQIPARADWQKGSNNLPILYALTAEHPDREEFRRLVSHVDDPESLALAQRILLRCGAVSYCAFKLLEFAREARSSLARIPLGNPDPIARLLDLNMRPLHKLFESVGVEEPTELALHTV